MILLCFFADCCVYYISVNNICSLTMKNIIGQQAILFYRCISTIVSTTLRILVNHKQELLGLPSLLANYRPNVLYLLASRDTIKFCIWNNFVSKTVNAVRTVQCNIILLESCQDAI